MPSVSRRIAEHALRLSAHMLWMTVAVGVVELLTIGLLYRDLTELSVSSPITLTLTLLSTAALPLGIAALGAAVLVGLLEAILRERRAAAIGLGLATFATLVILGISAINLVYPGLKLLHSNRNTILIVGLVGASLVAALVVGFRVLRRSPKPVGKVTLITGAALWGLVVAGWLAPFGIRTPVDARSDPELARTRPAGEEAPLRDRPVILLTVDTLRASHMGLYGYPRATTPGLDALAAEGTVFTRAMTPKSSTAPAIASLLTGLHPDAHQVIRNGTRLNENLTTIAERMAEAGYTTAAFLTNPYISARRLGFRQGLKRVRAYGKGKDDSDVILSKAMDWLSKQEGERIFLWVHVTDPHTPYDPPAPYDRKFRDDEYSRRFADVEFDLVEGGTDLGEVNPDGTLGEGWADRDIGPVDLESADFYVSQYDGEIAFTDVWMTKLIRQVREQFPGALVIFSSDHGESMVEHDHFFFHARYCYDTTAHVPLIVWNPDSRGPATDDRLVGLADIFPTISDLTGVGLPEKVEGRSFADAWYPEFRSPPGERAGVLVGARSSRTHPVRGIRNERWKLILTPRLVLAPLDLLIQRQLLLRSTAAFVGPHLLRSYRTELYDLDADPGETKDVSADHPDVRDRLRRALVEEAQAHWLDRLALDVTGTLDEFDAAELEHLKSLGYVR